MGFPGQGFGGGASSAIGSGGGGGFWSGFGNFLGENAGAFAGLLGGGGQQQVQAPPAFQAGGGGGQPFPSGGGNPFLSSGRTSGTLDEALSSVEQKERVGEPDQSKFAQGAERFLNNTNDLFSNDGKILGLGLLSQQDPRLMYAAIIANGLLGGKKDGAQ